MIKTIKKIFNGSMESQSADPEIQKQLDTIKENLNQGDLSTAEKKCLNLLMTQENNAALYRLYGEVLQSKNPAEAEAAFIKSTKIDSRNGYNWDELGLFFMSQDRTEEADKAFEKAVKCDSKNPLFHHHRGLALAELEWFLRAGRAQQHAIRLDNDFAEAHFALGLNYMSENQLKPAITAFKFAVKSRPDLEQAWRNLGLALRLYKEPGEAISSLQAACHANPENLEMIKYTAWMHREVNQPQEAVDLLQKHIDENLLDATKDAMTWFDLAESLLLLGDQHAALKACQQGIELDPDESIGMSLKGSILMESQQADLAETIFREALKTRPESDYLLGQLGLALDVLGRQAEAQLVYQQALAINPDNIDILTKSITFHKATEDDTAIIDRLENVLKTKVHKSAKNDQIKLRFSLGKLYDETKKHIEAFDHYYAANNLKFNLFDYDHDAIEKKVDTLIDYFQPEKLTDSVWPAWQGNLSEQPIFIIGMPRSGTSLVEQIIASHPQASGAGERSTLSRLLNKLSAQLPEQVNYPVMLDHISEQKIQELTDNYLLDLQGKDFKTYQRITDKSPYNFFHVGLISWLFPNAHIIHCQRDPMDTCISCYFQNFTSGNEHTFDLDALGEYYLQYQRLMEHWETVLPNKMININYEHLVNDTETESKRLINNLGLEWNPACLEFHKTKCQVLTASTWQVRQPVYKSSTKRCERYGHSFDLLREKLDYQDS